MPHDDTTNLYQNLLANQAASDRESRRHAAEVLEAQLKIVTATFDKAAAYTNLLIIGAYAGFFGLWQISEKHLSQNQRLWSALLVFVSIFFFVLFEVVKMVVVQRDISSRARELQSLQVQSDPEAVLRKLNEISSSHERIGLSFIHFWKTTMLITVSAGVIGALIVIWALISGLAR